MHPHRSIGLAAAFAWALVACSAGIDDPADTVGAGTGGGPAAGGAGQGAAAAQATSTGVFTVGAGGGTGDGGGPIINPCGTACGPVELCDGQNRGLDDDCDGSVDEDCPCGAGQASSCFMGDPSFLDAPGCLAGTMSCTELSSWGACVGGKHATAPDNCQLSDPTGCHPINAVPFQTVDLASGVGMFDDDADTETFTVTCPVGVSPCPAPTGSSYAPLQSGEYTVTYTKTVGGSMSTCTFPLYVGARGLRVEVSWNYQTGSVIDLDLHMHRPMTTTGWKLNGGGEQDCGYANCTASDFLPEAADSPEWFPLGNLPPDPVNWYDAPTDPEDLCYYAPKGKGSFWKNGNKGCHSPRLDLDNISCTPSVTDPQSSTFCAPENINIDFPPADQWIRVGVHYHPAISNFSGTVVPELKIYCDGQLAGQLGSVGYAAPFTLTGPADENKVWLAADVIVKKAECSSTCIVQPLYLDPIAKDPIVVTLAQAEASFSPAYPPVPP